MDDGLRARRRARTRTALLDAAADLFARRGYRATTVEDLAAAAEVAPRTFFRYFASKEEVLFAPYEAALQRWLDEVEAAPAGEALIAALRRATLAVNAAYRADPGPFDLLLAVLGTEPALARQALAFDGRAAQRAAAVIALRTGWDADGDLRPQVVAAATMAAVRATARTGFGDEDPRAEPAAVNAAFDLLERLSGELHAPLR